jgi:hypothetical protein
VYKPKNWLPKAFTKQRKFTNRKAESEEQNIEKKVLQALCTIILAVAFYLYLMPHMIRKYVTNDLVSESIEPYKLVKSTGNKIDMCA